MVIGYFFEIENEIRSRKILRNQIPPTLRNETLSGGGLGGVFISILQLPVEVVAVLLFCRATDVQSITRVAPFVWD
jgi:hypothetical protein